jgi:hypothetical protein
MSDTAQLNPCPFCGLSLEQDPQHPSDYDHPYNELCELSCQRFHIMNIEAWNRRVPPTMEAVLGVEVVARLWDAVATVLNTSSPLGYLFDHALGRAAAKFMEACNKENFFVWCRAVADAGYTPGGEL